MEIAAFDPGPHTGVAVYRDGNITRTLTITDVLGLGSQYRELAEIIDDLHQHATVVIEGHPARPRGGQNSMDTVKLIGFLEGFAAYHNLRCVLQQPAVRKPYEEEAKTYPHGNVHEVAAVAHVLAYWARYTGQHHKPKEGDANDDA